MSVLKNNKPFFLFLLKFGISYFVLGVIYWLYLSQYNASQFETDGITTIVTKQARDVLLWTGHDASIEPHTSEASYRLLLDGDSKVRIVEGCNAISVMILFTAFIIAFSSALKRTLLYIISGIIILYVLNIIRIALLVLGFNYYPEQKELLHDIVFPLFIYGVVFVLWVAWVMKFSANGKRNKN
ncbi:exosortase family protein XrtF [Flavobacterium sp. MK4S-17]|uniref:exosortase family protein XrtF n=1 Tax=Flavobacterium sp. MK4S-17 TaxID=2543737 RepID=UPI001357B2F7|nr:exosortase family protein XrtF [Flavobacterium sp. MK4S-17]